MVYSPVSRVRGGVVFISVVRALVLVLYGSVFLNSSLGKPRYEVSLDVVHQSAGWPRRSLCRSRLGSCLRSIGSTCIPPLAHPRAPHRCAPLAERASWRPRAGLLHRMMHSLRHCCRLEKSTGTPLPSSCRPGSRTSSARSHASALPMTRSSASDTSPRAPPCALPTSFTQRL